MFSVTTTLQAPLDPFKIDSELVFLGLFWIGKGLLKLQAPFLVAPFLVMRLAI